MTTQSITDEIKGATGMSTGMCGRHDRAGVRSCASAVRHRYRHRQSLVGWIIAFSGFAYLAYAFAAQGAGAFLWRTLIGVVYVIGGVYLAFHPGLALESLTLVVAAIFLAESVLDIVVFLQFRSLSGSGWILFDGVVTLLVAYLIWRPWPLSSTWAIGTLVGINLIVSGFTRLMYSVAARKTMKAMA